MAGGYPQRNGETNLVGNIPAAQTVALRWPAPVVWSGYEVGDAIHISQVKLPEGAAPAIEDRDFTIATVVAPSALKATEGEAEAAEAEAAAETEEAGEES